MWIFTSDEHLCGGPQDGADDFHHAAEASLRFHRHFADRATFVKLGDTMELHPDGQAHLIDILGGYMKLLMKWDELGNSLLLQPGNHDRRISRLKAFNWRTLPMIQVFRIHGFRILCLHGDRFDRWNKEGISLGRKITKVVGFLERHISPDMDRRLARAFTRLMTRVNMIDEGSGWLAREHGCDAVIHGHDHWPHEAEIAGIKVLDTGTWTRMFEDGYPFVRVEPGKLSLEYWP
jgi:UDP-2,3-diacylglucosamine pyrophosphatase LpxH